MSENKIYPLVKVDGHENWYRSGSEVESSKYVYLLVEAGRKPREFTKQHFGTYDSLDAAIKDYEKLLTSDFKAIAHVRIRGYLLNHGLLEHSNETMLPFHCDFWLFEHDVDHILGMRWDDEEKADLWVYVDGYEDEE